MDTGKGLENMSPPGYQNSTGPLERPFRMLDFHWIIRHVIPTNRRTA